MQTSPPEQTATLEQFAQAAPVNQPANQQTLSPQQVQSQNAQLIATVQPMQNADPAA